MQIEKPELLVPVGNIQKVNFAIKFGADAIYTGTNKFGLRYNKNFADIKELKKISELIHNNNKKIYITTNIFMHNSDIISLEKNIQNIIDIKPDALIVSDLGALSILISKRNKTKTDSSFEIHISTQANTTNFLSAKFYSSLGVDRIILARELTLKEIFEIKQYLQKNNLKIKLETFVHGAMCISYSGRCLLSLYMTSPETSTPEQKQLYRDANRGMCTHPCRWEYKIIEKKRNDEIFEIIEDNNYTYIMSSKDLNLLKHIPILILSGIDSFKIEGRMKSNHYLSATTLAYRLAIDYSFSLLKTYFSLKSSLKSNENNIKNSSQNKKYTKNIADDKETLKIDPETAYKYVKEPDLFFKEFPQWTKFYKKITPLLENFSHRPYTTGFYFIKSRKDKELAASQNKYIENLKYIGFTLFPSLLHDTLYNTKLYNSKQQNIKNTNVKNTHINNNMNYSSLKSYLDILKQMKININNSIFNKLNKIISEKEILNKILLTNINFYKNNNNFKYLTFFYAKNKFETGNNLFILSSDNNISNFISQQNNINILYNSNILSTNSNFNENIYNENIYCIIEPDNFIILDLDLNKVEFTKHSNIYILLSSKNINSLSILLYKK